ncbi:helix-turn-helix transcriptional regulator [Hoeflea poritis]|uniref:LuxR family transcriptional regulator n=1 Tax=Hoeflea poritis TaxID=2993659 RepID=A0ABT4VRF2_9HYPH|nr:LuxR family transcriptional regulator [Hoeflea poritis]MDA4847279.1 LuxR family transcriptional regulator [Hoeflea poritis]
MLTDDIHADVSALNTSFDVFKFLRKTTEGFGLRYFSVLALPGDASGSFTSHSIINNWPPDMIKTYDRLDVINLSSVASAIRRQVTPVVWHIDDVLTDDISEALAAAMKAFREKGFVRGVNFPVHDFRSLRGSVGFAGDRPPLENRELLELSMISIHIFDRLSRLTHHGEDEASPLSDRELECLRWTAAGKTSSEISTILSLSEHTVNHYLISATKKLDAVNRTQAVAKSIRKGWI